MFKKLLVILILCLGMAAQNKLPEPAYKTNPFAYTVGSVTEAKLIVDTDTKKVYAVLRIHPVGTYMLYPGDELTFCGNQRNSLDFTSNDVVILMYTKWLTHKGCHDLLGIFVIDKAHKVGE